MRGVWFVALAACGGGAGTPVDATSGDGSVSPDCVEAATYSNLANIEAKIFAPTCGLVDCHDGTGTQAGMLDLRTGRSRASLMRMSRIDPTRMLVVPNEPTRSYLLMMLQQITPAQMTPPASPPPSEIGFMPQGTSGQPLCAEKLGAIARWIAAGAAAD